MNLSAANWNPSILIINLFKKLCKSGGNPLSTSSLPRKKKQQKLKMSGQNGARKKDAAAMQIKKSSPSNIQISFLEGRGGVGEKGGGRALLFSNHPVISLCKNLSFISFISFSVKLHGAHLHI